MTDKVLKSSGSEQSFGTGAVRDVDDNKPALELISPIFEQRLGLWLAKGAKRYTRRNWEKGIPIERSLASLKRHVNAYCEGKTDEDHLAAIACNIMFIIHTEEMVKRGILPKELAFTPQYIFPSKEDVDSFEELNDDRFDLSQKILAEYCEGDE